MLIRSEELIYIQSYDRVRENRINVLNNREIIIL